MTAITPTWVITGASSGFGMAFARYALDRGYMSLPPHDPSGSSRRSTRMRRNASSSTSST